MTDRHKRIVILPTSIVATVSLLCLAQVPGLANGEWSRWATDLGNPVEGARRLALKAPDSSKVAILNGMSLFVEKKGGRLPGTEGVGVSGLAELAWAPDSAAFVITESLGGAVGEWRVTVFLVGVDRIRRLDVTREVFRRFRRHYVCQDSEEPNVGAVAWLKSSRKLLVVAEVPPHSSCQQMGQVRGYVVEVRSGKVVQEFTEQQLRARWSHDLGRRFGGR